MFTRAWLLNAAVLLLAGCPAAPPAAAPPAAPATRSAPAIDGLPVEVTVKQRGKVPVPGTQGSLTLSASDVTAGQVVLSLATVSAVILEPISLRAGESRRFSYRESEFELRLKELNNALIGEDFATVEISAVEAPKPLTEQEKIERLIAAVESLQGATFLRNGSEYSPAEAARHLREKRDHAGEQLRTAEQFINEIASASSLSGKEYEVRLPTGETLTARKFFESELRKLSVSDVPVAPGS